MQIALSRLAIEHTLGTCGGELNVRPCLPFRAATLLLGPLLLNVALLPAQAIPFKSMLGAVHYDTACTDSFIPTRFLGNWPSVGGRQLLAERAHIILLSFLLYHIFVVSDASERIVIRECCSASIGESCLCHVLAQRGPECCLGAA